MQDRVALFPGRVKLVPVSGQTNVYDLTRNDSPTVEGTPLNKENLLADTTCEALGISADTGTPNDALAALNNNKAGKSTTEAATLSSASWTGSSAPFSYALSISGVTSTSYQEIIPGLNITQAQLEALQGANIVDGGQSSGVITLKAWGTKPSIDIPIRVVKRGD